MRYSFANLHSFAMTVVAAAAVVATYGAADEAPPLGPPGTEATYRLGSPGNPPSNAVERVTLNLGPVESSGVPCQWLALRATKVNGQRFSVWIVTRAFPPRTVEQAAATTVHYMVQEGDDPPREFAHAVTGVPVLPTLGGWEYLWPRCQPQEDLRLGFAPAQVQWLGHEYELESTNQNVPFPAPRDIRKLALRPDVLVGVPSNRRTKDDTRRFDGSDYEMVRLTRDDYGEMIRAGLNCFNVDAEQAGWLKDEPVFYWGVGGKDVSFPECLYRSTYLGAALFLDEPAVGTRDYDIRPRLAKDVAFRHALTPQIVLEEFKGHFHKAVSEGAPTAFLKSLQARGDLDMGTMGFPQSNLYCWETMVASAAWELTAEPRGGPRAIVFEPPGRLGSRRTLPEMNMVYGCQLSPDDPANLAGILFGFLRGQLGRRTRNGA